MISSLWSRLSAWRGHSLANAFTLSAVLIAIVSSLVVALISLAVIYAWEQSAQEERLQSKSARLAEKVRSAIEIVESTAHDLGKSPLFTSALLDSRGRDTYVAPYLENYHFPIPTVTGMALCDYNGDKLAAMQSPISGCHGASKLYQEALLSGKMTRELDKTSLGTLAWILYQPVKHPYIDGSAGMIVAQIDLNDLLRPMPTDLDIDNAVLVRLDSSQVLASAVKVDPTHAGQASAITPLFKEAIQGLSLGVVAQQRHAGFQGRILTLFITYLMGCLLLVLGIVYVVRRASQRLIAPLTNLTAISNQIAMSGNLEVSVPTTETGEVGGLATAMDHMVRAMRDAEATLENKIELRTRELSASNEEAQAASKAKSQFLANMSHEIRTPMNAILGMLKLLQNTELTARQRDYASKTDDAAKSLLGLLNDILDFSKVEAGKMTLESQPFRIDRLLRNLGVILSTNADTKNIDVLFDIDPTLPDVVAGDAMRLQQVLINLGGNAIKFTSVGQVLLSLRKVGETRDTVTIEFALQDSGIGIAPENQEHIFSGFSQAEGSTTRLFGGTGLGLAISKRFLELMGSDIHIQSTLGVGSRFSFVLQLPVIHAIPEDMVQPARPVPSAQRALVIDDNEVAGNLSLRMIRSWGWHAEWACSGTEALNLIAAEINSTPGTFPFSVIYVDWQMPEMDGWETTKKIHQLAIQHHLPQPVVIMVSAPGREQLAHRSEAEQAMLSGFLSKPATASMLLDAYVDAADGRAGMRTMTRGRSSKRQLSGMRILVVEDNLINQQVAEELLSSEGAMVSLAANGRLGAEAVAAAAPPFDVVLMDIQMPVLDGYGATKVIREEMGLKHLPIIAMTANALASDRAACLAAGMNEHIGKPFDIHELVSLLIRITGLQASADNTRPAEIAIADPAPDAIPEIAGLDLATALTRMSGMRSLYARTAKEFCKTLDTVAHELRAHLLAGETNAAVMLLHTLKGNAGTLGAPELAGLARRLESLCKAGDTAQCLGELSELAEVLKTTQVLLNHAMDALAPAEASVPLGHGVPLDTAAVQTALHELQSLAGSSDMQALQRFAELRGVLEPLPDHFCDQLDQALQGLDLEAASVLCKSMLEKLSAAH